jgi:broad specificity phosphatase PhoE
VLYLVRHGQTAANAAGLIQGRRDYELTALGEQQAAGLRPALPLPARIISSPLRRARQTAEAIAAGTQLAIEVDDRWIEMEYGELEGRAIDDVRAWLWDHRLSDASWAPPGGESMASVAARVTAACQELAAASDAAEDVVVVSHVGPIKAAVAWALAVGPEVAGRIYLAVASITIVDISGPGGAPVLRAFNLSNLSAPSAPGTGGRAGSAG